MLPLRTARSRGSWRQAPRGRGAPVGGRRSRKGLTSHVSLAHCVSVVKLSFRFQGYRGTPLIKTNPPVGPYSRPMPRALWDARRWAISYERGTPAGCRLQRLTCWVWYPCKGSGGKYGGGVEAQGLGIGNTKFGVKQGGGRRERSERSRVEGSWLGD